MNMAVGMGTCQSSNLSTRLLMLVNAIAEAGLCVKKMVETRAPDEQSPLLSQLPKYMAWVAEKEDS